MAQYNPNWPRWIRASIAKHFDAGKDDTYLFVEGFERATESENDWIELRFDGPNLREFTKDQYRLYIEVNILVNVKQSKDNVYRDSVLQGRFIDLCNDCIDVYKYGTGPEDDQSHLGCLILSSKYGEKIQTSNFGMRRPDTRLVQSTIEAHYFMYLD